MYRGTDYGDTLRRICRNRGKHNCNDADGGRLGRLPATFVSELSSELLDKVICLIIIYFVLKAMPARFVVKLPNGKYFLKEKK